MQARAPIKIETAKQAIADAEEIAREKDRVVARPRHFHATVFTYVSKDDHGNFVDSLHHEVMALTVDGCVRKAKHRGERRQELHHIAQLSECSESGHSTGMAD